jgi:hypothetical protein
VALIAAAVAGLAITEWVLVPPQEVPPPGVCDGESNAFVVDEASRTLTICTQVQPHQTFLVRLGQGGTGKRAEGDRRTPSGRYRLDPPRDSFSGFGTFIPVLYPSAEQRAAGYTGSNIGIHGPRRVLVWPLRLDTVRWLLHAARPNSTAGCIGVYDDAAMQVLSAQWLRTQPEIVIR